MDIESTIETIAGMLPEDLDFSGSLRSSAIYVPVDIDFVHMAKFLLLFIAGCLILALLGRLVLGRHSSLNHSVSAAMGILFVYAMTILIYTFRPWSLENLLSPLPFVTFFGEYMVVLPVTNITVPILCQELLSLIILAFLVNLLDTFIPQGNTVVGWFLLRLIAVGLSMAAHLAARRVIDTYMPQILVTYAPVILLSLLVVLLVVGFINAVLGLILTITDPILGGIYTFFFSNIIGKQITKAVFTTGILSVILFLLDTFAYTAIHISSAALITYGPVAFVTLILWFLIGHLL